MAIEIAKRCGGDRGALGLMGPDTLPAAIKPNRLIVLETEGWPDVDAATKAGFAEVLGQLKAAGVTLIHRGDHPFVEALEKAIANARAVCNGITQLGEPLVPARHARRRARRPQRARQGRRCSRPRR